MAKKKKVKVEGEAPKPSRKVGAGGNKKKIIIAVVVVIIVIIAVVYFIALRDEDGGNGDGDGNQDPLASFTYSPEQIYTNQTVTFVASDSTDPDGDELEFSWDFGDPHATTSNPNTDSGETASHKYTRPGNYNVTLVAEDGKGGIDEEISNITVIGEETPTATILITKTLAAYESLTGIKWTINVQEVTGSNDQLSLNNIRFNIYNGSSTDDVKLTGVVIDDPPNYISTNDAGIYFDDVDDNSRLSSGDTFSIAGDGGGPYPVETGDSFQLIYKPPYFEEGVPMSDAETLPT